MDETTTQIVPFQGRVMSSNTLGLDDNEYMEAELEDQPIEEGHPNFIESNTHAISLEELEKNIIPTFADNQLSISHVNFIKAVCFSASKVFGELTPVEIRVSHPIIGRKPEFLHLKSSELDDSMKTCFYQRLAWIAHVKGLTREINGQTVELTIGGCRSYHEDKLYNRLSPMHFRCFVSWSVQICSNQMIQCSGNTGTFEALTEMDIIQKSYELFTGFNLQKEENLTLLQQLHSTFIPEDVLMHIIGRMRLYQFLPKQEQKTLPSLIIGDQAVNAMVKGYVQNPNFGRREGQEITCYNLMQLMNESVKQAYIDLWVDRNQNCTDFAIGIQKALQGQDDQGYSWFLN